MTAITNEFMQEMLTKVKPYFVVVLKRGPQQDQPDAQQIQWEHIRRNFSLREEGILHIVCPVTEEKNDVLGFGVLEAASAEAAAEIMDGDPAVQAGRIVYEVYACMSFPGDALK
jgi:uncharacterized protein YciI